MKHTFGGAIEIDLVTTRHPDPSPALKRRWQRDSFTRRGIALAPLPVIEAGVRHVRSYPWGGTIVNPAFGASASGGNRKAKRGDDNQNGTLADLYEGQEL